MTRYTNISPYGTCGLESATRYVFEWLRWDPAMVDLDEYLRLNSKEIVDFINRKYVSIEATNEPTFDKLATELQKLFVHNHSGTLWCRWLRKCRHDIDCLKVVHNCEDPIMCIYAVNFGTCLP